MKKIKDTIITVMGFVAMIIIFLLTTTNIIDLI